jgi:membrane-bound metal-dependent hydrolase YbcI (DUF457 family)
MPNSNKHAGYGYISGSAVTALLEIVSYQRASQYNPSIDFDWGEFFVKVLIGGAFGSIGGSLPDLIEPADSPHHRKFFHSKTAGGILVVGGMNLNKLNISYDAKGMIASCLAGYVSHLYSDSKTPIGLPRI